MMLEADEIRRRFAYDPETGSLTHLLKSRRTKVGDKAGSGLSRGYRKVGMNGKYYREHIVIWVHYYGEMPAGVIDHKDGNPSNNAISNLRCCTPMQNAWNSRISERNSVGFKGVTFHKKTKKYRARICVNGDRVWLGQFDNCHAAHAAYANAAKLYFGDFARTA